ncbi:glycosyltransferase family 1 protein [Amanita thiersii Skay4041]|uniref:sterol 3beta-glucosyltransferase n=1 Tax=Amanita thiersii Skay4041 TaxID=703135 RepID=A0A2A9P1R9_9AGAR|nr:glycosyltransferase family 1 protein [Amanita thiersii Skay4041]
MRAGTQTLIQALQALPWTDPDNYDEASNHDISSADSDSDEESRRKYPRSYSSSPWFKCPDIEGQLASSIHAIYRPLARSRRLSSPAALRRNGIAVYATVAEEPGQEDSLGSDEDDTEDFEYPTSHVHQSISNSKQHSPVTSLTYSRPPPARSCSGATVKLQRRARLAEKLRQVFDLPGIEEVWSEVPCWLLRSVLLQGYMYLTNSFLCFFAHMPCREDRILKSGSLNKKAQRTKRWIRHWFVLKNDALSWYQSSSDPYFPHGIVDLRYVISCDPLDEKEIRLRTNQKTVLLSADSVPNRDEWVKAIRKVIFKAQNMGDSIAIPYSLILDVEKSSAMDFSETIEVKVFEREEHYSVDSYFFAYFRDISSALDQIRDAVRMYRINPTSGSPQAVLDTTASRSAPNSALDRSTNSPTESSNSKGSAVFRLTSLLRPFSESMPFTRQLVSSPISEYKGKDTEDFTHVSKRINSSSFIPVTDSPIQSEEPMDLASSHSMHQGNMGMSSISAEHTYPPSTFRSSLHPDHLSLRRESSSYWNVGVPSWLKNSRRMFSGFTTSTSDTPSQSELPGVREMYSSIASPPTPTSKPSGLDLTYSVLETPELAVDADTAEKFRTAFAYDEKEILLGYFPGYIFRLLPIYGRLYISTNYFCFKSSGPLASRTRMALPIRDILSIEKSKATRFGHHGLVVIIRGHEELFFEFGAEDKRDAFVTLLEHQMEDVRRILSTGEINASSQPKQEALILEEYKKTAAEDAGTALAVPESMTDSLPTVMFTSTSSTFLTFKPSKPLHFTFLTIGSRGDVQPYIALAKGLMADGHRCRIATHGEFQAWIESYGIEFGYVGGDPAELMRICVENGTFTVSFLKEGLLKFRGWLDDLLKTSWEACQGTDVLVESPSAMGGYHIAEALRIPYFRAFTMTWTRTRSYPHAFAVPERKMGGSYNYMSYVMFDQVFWRATSGQINRWRRNVLHLDSTSLDRMEPHKIPFIYNFSPHVVPPPLDWPEWIRVAGYWFLDDADVSATKWTPPLDLVEFIDNAHASGKKVVYIGFGSIVVSDPKGMTQCVVEAVVRSGVYAILSKGWSDRLHSKTIDSVEPEVPLPEQIYSISSIPHDWLFRRIDAACHHGGAGTTGASLRAGIPTIIKPFFGDQYFWADRVEALGVGSGVRKLTVPTLTEALTLATTDQKQVHRAKLLGEQIRSEDGVATAIESIYRDLEYARSLIKRAPADSLSCDDEVDAEHSNDGQAINPSSSSGRNSGSCARRVPSEEWSVISEQDDRRSSVSSRHSEGHLARDNSSKRASFTAAVLSVLPDALTPGSPRRRSLSLSSGT